MDIYMNIMKTANKQTIKSDIFFFRKQDSQATVIKQYNAKKKDTVLFSTQSIVELSKNIS